MSKKTLLVALVILLIIAAVGGFFLSRTSPATIAPASESSSTPETIDTPAPATGNANINESHFDDRFDETRIILSEPDNSMLNELLADKVIRDDKIVNKSQASQ